MTLPSTSLLEPSTGANLSIKKQLRLQKMALLGANYKPKEKIFDSHDM